MTRLVLSVLSLFSPDGCDDALVRRLGADDWSERDRAGAALARRGWGARAALKRGTAHDDPEVRHRCEELYAQVLSDAVADLGPLPMLDALWFDTSPPSPGYRLNFNRLAYDYFNPYLDRVGRDGYSYRNYYAATDLAVRDMLEAGVPPWLLRVVLAEMTRRDRVFLAGTMPPPRD